MTAVPALTVNDLRAYYATSAFGVVREVRAVDDVSLRIERNEIYGLAGESSCGKSTLIRTIAGAIRPPLRVRSGDIVFNFGDRRLVMQTATQAELTAIRWKHLSYVMQGSMSVLNPVRRVRHSFVDFAYRHIGGAMPKFLDGVRNHLQRLDLAPEVLEAYPHELSGGMRQRVAIALATICRPDFIIADEPTTALDVVVQKSVLVMIRAIQRELGSSLLFVTHDMSVHANLSDRLGIMYAGRLVEEAATAGESDLEAAEHDQHAEGHDEGAQPKLQDQESVYETDRGAEEEGQRDGDFLWKDGAQAAVHNQHGESRRQPDRRFQ